MMLAHTRHRSHHSIVRVGADTTGKPFNNKYMTIGLVGGVGLLFIGQAMAAAILLGSALGASAMIDTSS